MELQIRNDFKSLTSTVEQWRELVLATPGQPFFMLPEYQQAWWQHLGHGSLEILEFTQNQELVGLLPLYIDTVNDKQVARIVGAMDESDYLDVLAKPENRPKINQLLLKYFANKKIDELWIECLQNTSITIKSLLIDAEKTGLLAESVQQTVAPVITLPKTYSEYLQSLPSKQQKNFKNLIINLGEEDEISYRLITTPPEVRQAMASFIILHKASSLEKASFWNPAREAFFVDVATELAKQDLVKLYFLDVNGQPAATMLIFDWQNQFLGYNSGFDNYAFGYLGVSNALVLHTIEAAIKLGRSRYDFMRGGEAYKLVFGSVPEPVYDLKISR